MEKVELVFIPSPGPSHLVSTVETARLLLHHDGRLSITVLTMKDPHEHDTSIDNYRTSILSASNTPSRLNFIAVPAPPAESSTNIGVHEFINSQTSNVREIISNLIKRTRLAGIVLDIFCMSFTEVSREFGIPSYLYFTSGACALGVFLFALSLKLQHNTDLSEYKDSDVEFSVPVCSLPVPAKVIPAVFFNGGPNADFVYNSIKRITETKGVLVNTFHELEPYAVDALMADDKIPRVYPVGPILSDGGGSKDEVMKWLDEQDENSVVFLCFGTMGSFIEAQVREIAVALERSGCRFLWSLRKPRVGEYDDLSLREVLPEGFLERTKDVGKVIGWAAQTAVLAHAAVGGFVSHCGWNSILESIWFGVPIATFPLYAEQQMNAFYLVKEMGMAEMIKVDYHMNARGEIVGSEEIGAGIRRLMVADGVRERVKEMQKKSRVALLEGGSSYNFRSLFIEDVVRIGNTS